MEKSMSKRIEERQENYLKSIVLTLTKMAQENKLIKTITDAATLMGLAAGVVYVGKKILKENFLGDPSSNVMNYVKFTEVLAGSIALNTYLEDKKIIPKSI